MTDASPRDWSAAVLAIVAQRHDQPFLIDADSGRTFTYGEFHRLACALAAQLQAHGVGPGGRVMLVLPNSPVMAALYFACLYLGAAAVPVNLQTGVRDWQFIAAHAGADVLVYDSRTEALVDAAAAATAAWRRLRLVDRLDGGGGRDALLVADAASGSDFRPVAGWGANQLLSITYTSGTTGRPKGVAHRVDALLAAATAFNAALGFDEQTRLLHVLPMAYMAGFLNTLLCPFMAGGSVVTTGGFDAAMALRFWRLVMTHRVNTLWLVPTIASALLRGDRNPEAPRYGREHLRAACVGTAPLPARVQADFTARYGVPLLESYGLSETLFVATNVPDSPWAPGSVGRPLSGVELQVRDGDGAPLPEGAEGEIWIRSPFQMAGYLDPETARPVDAAQDGWFPSGDIGRLSEGGPLVITGRKKDLIIRGGVNVSPQAVADVLMEHAAVEAAVVVGVPDDLYGEAVAAVVVLRDGHDFEAVQPELAARCRALLSPPAVPGHWLARPALPMGPTGKVLAGPVREWVLAELGAPRR